MFKLSLIAPQEWGGGSFGQYSFGQYVGECVLQPDVTWTLNMDDAAARDALMMSLIEKRRAAFEQALQEKSSVDAVLPFYLDSLPFYQRVFASGLASSLRASMVKSCILGLAYADALQRLEADAAS